MPSEKQDVEMVTLPRDVAEWATLWHERCESGRKTTKAAAKWTLIFFGAVGTIGYGIVQLIQAIRLFEGR